MVKAAARWFAGLPTAAKLLLILTALLLPIGVGLTLLPSPGIHDANDMLRQRSAAEARTAARAAEGLIARNALALRVAARRHRRRRQRPLRPSARGARHRTGDLAQLQARDSSGKLLCSAGGFVPRTDAPLVAPGDIRVWIDPDGRRVDLRVGVVGGMATASVTTAELRSAALDSTGDGQRWSWSTASAASIDRPPPARRRFDLHRAADRQRCADRAGRVPGHGGDHDRRALLLLPLLMWVRRRW